MAYSGKKALVKVTGTATAMTGEPTTTTDNQNYQITDETKRIIALESNIVVKEDGIVTTESYNVNRLNGTITFETVDATRGSITIDADYLPVSTAAEAYEYSSTINGELIDVTKFASQGWMEKKQGLKSLEGSISNFYSIDAYFANKLISGDTVVIELYAQSDLEPDKCFAKINSDEMSSAVDGVVEDSVSFESTNKMLAAYTS